MTMRLDALTHDRAEAPAARRPARPAARFQQDLARARSLALQVVSLHSDVLPDSARRAVVSSAKVTSTEVTVVVLAPVGEPPSAVIKIPMSDLAADRLNRETAALAALHRDERLGRWRRLLPEPRAQGKLRGQPYRVDSALVGRPVLERRSGIDGRRTLLNVAVETIATLHRSTAMAVSPNLDLATIWVDLHLRELTRVVVARRPLTLRIERLRDELREALSGRTFSASWIHGDYWLGNLLFSTNGSMPEHPRGIVDWDAAAPFELPLHDVLHLLLYNRRLTTGQELGRIVRDQVLQPIWSEEERRVLERHATWCHDGLADRHALLLYWLRHVAMHARQQSSPGSYRCRFWARRNVLSVLAAL